MAQPSSGVRWGHPCYPVRSQRESDLCSLCVQGEQPGPGLSLQLSLYHCHQSHGDPPDAAKGRV